jgi:hypothetical protein
MAKKKQSTVYESTVRVRALISFVAHHGDLKFRAVDGQELDMPMSADWIRAGLAMPATPEAAKALAARREIAAVAPAERAVAPEPQPRVMGTSALHAPAPEKSEVEQPVKRPRKKRT